MKRIIGLIICILVISSFSVGGQKLFTNNIKQTPNVNTFDDDVPIWQIGEKWIFEMETLYIETFSSSATIRLDAAMKNLVFELKTISETQYQLDISGNITLHMKIDDVLEESVTHYLNGHDSINVSFLISTIAAAGIIPKTNASNTICS